MKILGACLAAVLLLGCSGPEVHYDYDVKASYAAFHSYDWYAPPPAAMAEGERNAFMDARVRRAVETEMASRHFQKETSAEPDLLVIYYPVYRPRGSSQGAVGFGMGFGGFRGPGVGVGVAAPLGGGHRGMLGSIVLEIEQARTHRLVWKAVADDVLDDSASPADADQDVTNAVQKMFRQFPPKS
jgi:hypothetical protein